MLVSFNPYMQKNRIKTQSPVFRGIVKDLGTIIPTKVAKDAFEAESCYNLIFSGCYKPTIENIKALVEGMDIANKKESIRAEILPELVDNVKLLIKKAKEKNILEDIIKEAKTQKNINDLIEKAKKYELDLSFLNS